MVEVRQALREAWAGERYARWRGGIVLASYEGPGKAFINWSYPADGKLEHDRRGGVPLGELEFLSGDWRRQVRSLHGPAPEVAWRDVIHGGRLVRR